MKSLLTKNRRDVEMECSIEAGQTFGMGLQEVLDSYLETRNNIISILRMYYKKTSSSLASELGISEDELEKIENSKDLVPFQLVPKMAKIFNIDLKMLLIFLGHANPSSEDETSDHSSFAMAAQYSGPDLAKQEKIDLNDLFKTIVENAKSK